MGDPRGRFNLSRLLEGPFPSFPLKAAADYLQAIYGDTIFSKHPEYPDSAYRLLEAIVQAQQAHQRKTGFLAPLETLRFDSRFLNALYYKMLRGKTFYGLSQENELTSKEKKCIPPLSELFIFEERESIMNFHYAPEAFLEVLFGKELTTHLKTHEKKGQRQDKYKKKSILENREILQHFLDKRSKSSHEAAVALFSFDFKEY